MTEGQDPNVASDQPTPPPTPQAAPPQRPPMSDKDVRTWAMLCHLSALAAFIGIPAGNVVGPLIVWLVKRESNPIIDQEGKKALNFQITVLIAMLICFALAFVLIGLLLMPVVGIAALVFTIIASVKANNGESYEYPFSIKFLK